MSILFSFFQVNLGPIRGLGKIGFEGEGSIEGASSLLETLVSGIVGFMSAAAVLWFVVQIIIAGYSWMTAGGDPKAVDAARSRLTNSIIGLVVVFAALILVSLIGFLLGIENILGLRRIICNITPGCIILPK